MSTTYTEPVSKGEASLESFAWHCAQVFFHDGWISLDACARSIQQDVEEEARLRAEIARWRSLPTEEVGAMQSEKLKNLRVLALQNREHRISQRKRYRRMAAAVEAWKPAENLVELKAFMLSQISTSIAFDCPEGEDNDFERYIVEHPVEEFRTMEMHRLQRLLAMTVDGRERREKTLKRQQEFIQALTESMGPRPEEKR